MVKLSGLRIDADKANNGVWHDWRGVRWLIARMGNPAYQEKLEQEMEPILHVIAANEGKKCDERDNAIMVAAAHGLLLDWEQLEDDNGNDLDFSPEAALRIFKDPELRDVYDFVMTRANAQQFYLREETAKLAGN